ncbi:hypothetical protein [Kutzneria sp. 744]|uniref:hypothetical protein n=1 Tax=Kutzneria sp. (strain 744) TaxID=345341 RepID=UPI0003EEDF62|nr:hypothetical protein [Kutzneria sp. 744]EWM19837.1 LigA protein [Kutzneria sp. 744]
MDISGRRSHHLEQRYSAHLTALSAARLTTIHARLVEEFADQVRADPDDATAGVVIKQVAQSYLLVVRQPPYGRRPSSTDESLLNRIAAQRARCTGEDPRAVAQRLAPVVGTFAADQRAAVDAALSRGFETRLLGAGTQIVDEHTRHALLPAASTAQQQRLEAEVLLALGQALSEPRGVRLAGRSVVPRIHLHGDGRIDLVLSQHLGAEFLRALLPRVDRDQVIGAAGVRVRPTTMTIGVRLCLADDSNATVHVHGIGQTILRKATADMAGRPGSLVDPDHTNRPLLAPERDAIANPHDADLSALLRRVHILGKATSMAISGGSPGVAVSWRDGRDAPTVACELVHPLTGLAGDQFHVTWDMQHDKRGAVTVSAASAAGLITLRRENGRVAASRQLASPDTAVPLAPARP